MDEARRRRRTSKFRRWSRLVPRTSNKEEGYFCRSLDKVEGSFVRNPNLCALFVAPRRVFFFCVLFLRAEIFSLFGSQVGQGEFLLSPSSSSPGARQPISPLLPPPSRAREESPPFCSVRRSTMFECVSRTFISFYLFSLLFLFPSPSTLPPIPAAAAKANANNVFFFSLC